MSARRGMHACHAVCDAILCSKGTRWMKSNGIQSQSVVCCAFSCCDAVFGVRWNKQKKTKSIDFIPFVRRYQLGLDSIGLDWMDWSLERTERDLVCPDKHEHLQLDAVRRIDSRTEPIDVIRTQIRSVLLLFLRFRFLRDSNMQPYHTTASRLGSDTLIDK